MKLEEQFDNVELMFEGQNFKIRYDELCNASKLCIKLADNHAIRFNNWVQVNAYKYPTETTSEQLLKIYKKTL